MMESFSPAITSMQLIEGNRMKATCLKTLGAVASIMLFLNHGAVYAQDWSGVVKEFCKARRIAIVFSE